jgi:hypothetical protein
MQEQDVRTSAVFSGDKLGLGRRDRRLRKRVCLNCLKI